MKKVLFAALAILLMSQIAYSQILVNGKKPKIDNIKYMEVEFIGLVGSNQVKVFMDFGQEVSFLDRKKRQLSDRKGKAMVFNSRVQGLNFFFANGWAIKEVYNLRNGGEAANSDLIYLLEKVKDGEEN